MKDIVKTFDVKKYHAILDRGLSKGIGERDSQMCIEAAICATLDLPHDDDPGCVAQAVREFKIRLNDSAWSSPEARANGLRDLGLAQLGSKGVVDDVEFSTILSKKIITKMIPTLFREVFPNYEKCLAAADRCEKEGTADAARYAASEAAGYASDAARYASYARDASSEAARYARYAVRYASDAARYAAIDASEAARYASDAGTDKDPDKYLRMCADLGLDTLIELKSPGCALLEGERG